MTSSIHSSLRRTARTRVRRSLLVAVSAGVLLCLAPLAHADGLREDLVARRARLMATLTPDTLAILWSAPERVYSLDVDYEYRQDSDLQYLTGIAQPETVLVLMPGNRTRREILFIRPPDARREHWEGHSLTKEEAAARSGIETVYFTTELDGFLDAIFNRLPYGTTRIEAIENDEYSSFFEALAQGTARVGLRLGRVSLSGPPSEEQAFAARLRERLLQVTYVNIAPAIHALRQVKTPYEQAVLRRSLEISSEAHVAGMRAAAPGRYEYEVEAAIEGTYLRHGAMSPGYPSIVGSGPNATILHYNESSRRMEDGDLLLVDAAASYQGLTGDITRTYPVNGTFSPAQRELYSVVLEAQEAGMRAARVGGRTIDIEKAVREAIKAGLLELGLITDASSDQYKTWYTHGICHWIGMDVHDVGDYRRPLEPGMTFTIEPGVYIRPAALEQLPDTPENAAFKKAVAPAVEKYKNMGVRVEDSFLLTETGLERLSSAPRTIDEIERAMKAR